MRTGACCWRIRPASTAIWDSASINTAWRAPARSHGSWRSSSASGRATPSSASVTCAACRATATSPGWKRPGCWPPRWCARRRATPAVAPCCDTKPVATWRGSPSAIPAIRCSSGSCRRSPSRLRERRHIVAVAQRQHSAGALVSRPNSYTLEAAGAPPSDTSRAVMIESRLLRRLGPLVALAVAYFVAGKLGLQVAFVNASATSVWPPAGIALAAFVLLGYDVWPAVLVSAFLVNLTTAGSVGPSLGIAIGNTLEGVVGAYLVNQFARGRRAFDRAQDVFAFAALAAGASTMVSATLGVTSLSLAGFARWSDYGPIWSTWWLGDAVGDLVVAPAVMLWAVAPRIRWSRAQLIEAVALLLWVIVVGLAVFGGLFPSHVKNYPLEFFLVPFLIWRAVRVGPREAASAVVVLSGIATWGTLHGFGPFVQATPNESLLLLQSFMGVTSVMTLALAALVAERKQGEDRLRQLAGSDPLTGPANYRQPA